MFMKKLKMMGQFVEKHGYTIIEYMGRLYQVYLSVAFMLEIMLSLESTMS